MSFPPSEYTLREAVHSAALAEVLPAYIRERRWFGGKSRTIASVEVIDAVPIPSNSPMAYACFVAIHYTEGADDTYLLPLAYADGPSAAELRANLPQAIIADAEDLAGDGALFDAVYDPVFCDLLLGMIGRSERFAGGAGVIVAEPTVAFDQLRSAADLPARISKAEQSNTSIIYGNRLILKLFRRVVAGLNPDLEIGRYLTAQNQFQQIAPVAGSIMFERADSEPVTLGVLLGYVENRGDAWAYVLDLLGELREQITSAEQAPGPPERDQPTPTDTVAHWFGPTLDAVRLLGQRTAEMHLALGANTNQPDFAPEPFGTESAQAEVAAMNALADRVFSDVRVRLDQQPKAVRADLQTILDHEGEIRNRFGKLTAQPLTALRTRTHGDYHLGQVLATENGDFVIIDFEGEPARTLAERRAKRSPLRDVAGMLRSFDYAAATALAGEPSLEPWRRSWVAWAMAVYLDSYLATAIDAVFLPRSRSELDALLEAFLIEKAVYELQYELNNRPDWIRIPAQGVLGLVG